MNNEEQEANTNRQDPVRSGAMTYQDYDEQYPQVFAEVVKAIQAVLPSAHIEHVGSTSIPGLGSRNVLDIVVAAEPARHEEMESELLRIGFVKSPFPHFLPMLTRSMRYHDQDHLSYSTCCQKSMRSIGAGSPFARIYNSILKRSSATLR